ncbi:hypothetical protein TRFO_10465 [Tritrichomonas foetus]|uniref:Uncharacterized protein n=1 Tax=Tritrichomonas foetus TaxID=1144522 RepID=A0A1J4J8Q7_9EUKA|nr:hypothetical protein TRFO_10465 [Tritrichomonas foetus]|eukprot:OHS95566.1 hypothetical protein TRFO_10465 [Tritrichomonas foetus]
MSRASQRLASTAPPSRQSDDMSFTSIRSSSDDPFGNSESITKSKSQPCYCDISRKPKKLFFPPIIGPKKVGPVIKYAKREEIQRMSSQSYADEIRRKYTDKARSSPYHRDYTRMIPSALRHSRAEKTRRMKEDFSEVRRYDNEYRQRMTQEEEREKLRCKSNIYSSLHKDLRIIML